jgi:hypothetical protein
MPVVWFSALLHLILSAMLRDPESFASLKLHIVPHPADARNPLLAWESDASAHGIQFARLLRLS